MNDVADRLVPPAGNRPHVSVAGMIGAGVFHYGRVLGNGSSIRRAVAAALDATADERVLDVGCGTGGFCVAVRGDYVGIDINTSYVAFARWRWGGEKRQFLNVELAALDATEFDRAVLINCLHHLSNAQATDVLARLAMLVRVRLVVADLDPQLSNWLQALLLKHDRGHFIRPADEQRALLANHFIVRTEHRFRNTPHTAVQTLFVCEPRR